MISIKSNLELWIYQGGRNPVHKFAKNKKTLCLHYSTHKSTMSPKTHINHEVEVLVVGVRHINSTQTTLEYPESAIINVVLGAFSKT